MSKILMTLAVVLTVVLLISVYYNFTLSFKSNHCDDNLFLINEDLNTLSEILRSRHVGINAFESLPDSLKQGFQKEDGTIRFQVISITFDEKGNIEKISH